MAYSVFISHSTRDRGLVIALSNLLAKFGVKVFVAEWYLTPGASLNKKVFAQIERTNCMVVLLTKNGIRSNWVQQEIGYAIKTHKPLIPLVEKGADSRDLAALQEKEYHCCPKQPEAVEFSFVKQGFWTGKISMVSSSKNYKNRYVYL